MDNVNHPQHYKGKGIESIEVIEGFDLGFHLGNAVKYILRAGKKGDRVEDARKAIWYLERQIKRWEDEGHVRKRIRSGAVRRKGVSNKRS